MADKSTLIWRRSLHGYRPIHLGHARRVRRRTRGPQKRWQSLPNSSAA